MSNRLHGVVDHYSRFGDYFFIKEKDTKEIFFGDPSQVRQSDDPIGRDKPPVGTSVSFYPAPPVGSADRRAAQGIRNEDPDRDEFARLHREFGQVAKLNSTGECGTIRRVEQRNSKISFIVGEVKGGRRIQAGDWVRFGVEKRGSVYGGLTRFKFFAVNIAIYETQDAAAESIEDDFLFAPELPIEPRLAAAPVYNIKGVAPKSGSPMKYHRIKGFK